MHSYVFIFCMLNAPRSKSRFLSNFFWSELNFEGLTYPSVEHAFQAAKLRENQQRNSYCFTDSGLSFGDAKRLGRQVPLRDDWKEIREDVMARCLWAKFQDPQLRAKLLGTGESELVDGHSGSPDLIWGFHIPSQKGENRLGILLMELRAQLNDLQVQHLHQVQLQPAEDTVALFHLDWPVKCLHAGLPSAYATRLQDLAAAVQLAGCCVVLPRRKICIALQGPNSGIDAWEQRMRSEHVDVNSRGRPCRERMLMELLRQKQAGCMQQFNHQEVKDWPSLLRSLSSALGLPSSKISSALGPEVPELPQKVQYLEGRSAVLLDGQRHALCLNESVATEISQALLGPVEVQTPLGPGIEIRLGSSKKPSIFGGKFARELPGLLSEGECQQLIDLSEKEGYGLAGLHQNVWSCSVVDWRTCRVEGLCRAWMQLERSFRPRNWSSIAQMLWLPSYQWGFKTQEIPGISSVLLFSNLKQCFSFENVWPIAECQLWGSVGMFKHVSTWFN